MLGALFIYIPHSNIRLQQPLHRNNLREVYQMVMVNSGQPYEISDTLRYEQSSTCILESEGRETMHIQTSPCAV